MVSNICEKVSSIKTRHVYLSVSQSGQHITNYKMVLEAEFQLKQSQYYFVVNQFHFHSVCIGRLADLDLDLELYLFSIYASMLLCADAYSRVLVLYLPTSTLEYSQISNIPIFFKNH